MEEIYQMIDKDEIILLKNEIPKKVVYIKSIFNNALPFVGFFVAIHLLFVWSDLHRLNDMLLNLVYVVLSYIAPIGLYLIYLLEMWGTLNNACFVITDKKLYSYEGILSKSVGVYELNRLSEVHCTSSIINSFFHVRDIRFDYDASSLSKDVKVHYTLHIYGVADYDKALKLLKGKY